jgi:RimJ/RimL family protein N-acetyltransferase
MSSIETERLLLRPFRLDDLDELAALFGDPDVMRYVGTGLPIGRDETDRALKSIIKHWDHFVGFGGLRSLFDTPEVVYHFSKPNWGKGLATEQARASLRFGFEDRRFHRIVAVANPENNASIHVMEKLGMHFEMYTTYYNIDVIQYEIKRDEFKLDDSLYILHETVN